MPEAGIPVENKIVARVPAWSPLLFFTISHIAVSEQKTFSLTRRIEKKSFTLSFLFNSTPARTHSGIQIILRGYARIIIYVSFFFLFLFQISRIDVCKICLKFTSSNIIIRSFLDNYILIKVKFLIKWHEFQLRKIFETFYAS